MTIQPILIAGRWRPANASGTFRAENPATREPLDEFPISTWDDCDEALTAAVEAFEQMRLLTSEKIAGFLEAFAARIEVRKDETVRLANQESALSISPRSADN